jgi:peptide/nickel transport system substrate-binding protein
LFQAPDTLDPHNMNLAVSGYVSSFYGATLVAVDPDNNFVPYLAESWKISDDGLTWDFTLKQGVKFHDGTPLTAEDFVWSFERAMSGETTGWAGSLLDPLESAEALDDATLRLKLKEPFAPFLFTLTDPSMQPLPEQAVEKLGEQFGQSPIGVGPYIVTEYLTGDTVVMERNPDFNWGPAFGHAGPSYIEKLVFKTIPEAATAVAGLETGEIDIYYQTIDASDVQRVKDAGHHVIYEGLFKGSFPEIYMNTSKPPFDDVRVRQALNLAVDKDFMIKAILQGQGVQAFGPISPAVIGYWPGVEEIGYKFDLEQAKTLMQEAGYTYNGDGMLEKDGQPLQLRLTLGPRLIKEAEIVQEQWKKLGIEVKVEALDYAARLPEYEAGTYDFTASGFAGDEADILWYYYHSSQIGRGGANYWRAQDAELDALLDGSRTETDPAKRQEILNQVQKRIVDQAYDIFLYSATQFVPVHTRIKGVVWSDKNYSVYLNDAYIQEK